MLKSCERARGCTTPRSKSGGAYRAGVSVSLYSQFRELTAIRAGDPFWGVVSVQIGRGVLRRADRARRAFYRRASNGETPGYPRFKSGRRWHTIELANVDVSMLRPRGNHCAIRVKGLPEIRLRKGLAPPEGVPKALSVTQRGRRLFVNLDIRGRNSDIAQERCRYWHRHGRVRQAGVVQRRARGAQTQTEQAACWHAQRRLSGCKKDGHRWRKRKAVLANHQHREHVRNRNECHRVTTNLVRRFGLIAVEGLPIKNMTRSAAGTLEKPGTGVAQTDLGTPANTACVQGRVGRSRAGGG